MRNEFWHHKIATNNSQQQLRENVKIHFAFALAGSMNRALRLEEVLLVLYRDLQSFTEQLLLNSADLSEVIRLLNEII